MSTEPALYADHDFTGYKHLPWFGLVNMNGRLYDPAVGRFLSADPYVQVPSATQSLNRYSYCINNPLKYIDINGFTWFTRLGDWLGKNGQAIVSTVVTIGVAVGVTVLIAASGGTLAPLAIAAIAGASGGLAGSLLNTAFAGGSGMDYLRNGAIGMGVGAISGMAGYGVGKLGADLASKGLVKLGAGSVSPVFNGSVTGAIGASAGGAGSGYAGGFLSTFIQTGDLKLANKAGLSGMKTGAITGLGVGAATGAYGGYKYAKSHNLDPWSGNSLSPKYDFTPDPNGDNVTMYRGTTGSEGKGGPLFMTDNPEYAATYVKNGGQVVEVTISRTTYNQLYHGGLIQTYQGLHGGSYGFEYRIDPSIVPNFLQIFK